MTTIDPLSLKGLTTYSRKDRPSKVSHQDFARPWTKGGSFQEFLERLPNILAGQSLREIAAAWVRARQEDRTVLLGMGAHPLKVVLSPVLIDLLRRGLINGLAMNGAGIVHDAEITMAGRTSEDVDQVLGEGRFGMAKETAEFLNTAHRGVPVHRRRRQRRVRREPEQRQPGPPRLREHAAPFRRADRHLEPAGVDQRIAEVNERDAGLLASFMFDSRDAATFALRGAAAELLYLRSDQSLGGDRDWSRAEGGLRKGFEIRENATWLTLAGGIDLSEDRLPGDRSFSFGGPRTLPAYQLDEFRVRNYWLADVSFLWRLVDLIPVRNQSIYGGIGLTAAGLYDRVDRIEDGGCTRSPPTSVAGRRSPRSSSASAAPRLHQPKNR